ncbi:putative diphthamide synthesis protein-domain-containing protein [Chaetomium strumarium]|uniref:2-(3-amino-3-carboxypropyl)histidine synthase subunit 2 n=1 Tax=Chaetomium strumarium TaxID=1170767 RepID=A0AAJ0GT91_9PEZI|nr:putative diphthamide synthesis protein-domain-containing protein [Chaetomium strumarium]
MAGLSAAPVLSTPAEHAFEYAVTASEVEAQTSPKTDDELRDIYEIARTAREIRQGAWKRIALQFPDAMLRDAPRVLQALNAELEPLRRSADSPSDPEKIYILADTSYSACCVDEIAAEHVDADVVVHYGRSCLSPTSRLPVICVFTHHNLERDETLAAFEKQYPDRDAKVVLMADVTYQNHIPSLASELQTRGYTNLLSTAVVRDPTGQIPNRKFVTLQGDDIPDTSAIDLKTYSIFHISTPPTALLLVLSSRVQALHIHPTTTSSSQSSNSNNNNTFSTQRLLGRRYARCLSLASAGVIGILVNTLSVSNYLSSVDAIRKQVAAAGKKSYTMVVGKLNPAKLANFAEVDGWVVVGCWESSLVEEEERGEFYRPVVTPFELEVALMGDDKRVWSGEWWGGIERKGREEADREGEEEREQEDEEEEYDEEESAPPEFDLRTGRLISTSRPMRRNGAARGVNGKAKPNGSAAGEDTSSSSTLALRPKAELAMVNGVVSPGAEYLRSQRTWQGLGSDYAEEASTAIEEGRSGLARGYTVGEDAERR